MMSKLRTGTSFRFGTWLVLALSWLTPLACAVADEPKPSEPAAQETEKAGLKKKAPKEKDAAAEQKWLPSLAEGKQKALADKKPLLVRVGGEFCPWCKKLEKEIADPDVQTALANWTLVYIDAGENPDDARKLNVSPIPALRVLSPEGDLTASHDGYLPAAELLAWLEKSRAGAAANPDAAVLTQETIAAGDVPKLFSQLESRHPTVREAALRRLYTQPTEARAEAIKLAFSPRLASRLAALELLDRWKAPIDGLDPWQPRTLTDERRATLTTWSEKPLEVDLTKPQVDLAEDQLAAARRTIDRMLSANDEDATAMREQLAHLGEALLPEVTKRLVETTSDYERSRLLALRYRLAASDQLALRWPGGIERLAALDSTTRRAAADELVTRVTPADQLLLLELFADPDPLVREVSLRAMQHVGGEKATEALAKRLNDPEPNVRAAVLKQLAEKPMASLVEPVTAYIVKEEDSDLVVHAIRFLKAVNNPAAKKTLGKLLEHASWQVRAEAAESLKGDAESLPALTALLDDSEPFVIAKALEAIGGNGTVPTLALMKAAEKHPNLAPTVIDMLVHNESYRDAAPKNLKKLCTHEQPAVRAAALAGLSTLAPTDCTTEALVGLSDEASKVRIAAADAVFAHLDKNWPAKLQPGSDDSEANQVHMHESYVHIETPSVAGQFFSGISRLLGGGEAKPTGPAPQQIPPPADATVPTVKKPDAPEEDNKKEEPEAAEATTDAPAEGKAAKKEPPDPVVQISEAIDAWLKKNRKTDDRSDDLAKAVAPLRKMLEAKFAEERVAAARALALMGDAPAIELLQKEAIAAPRMIPEIAKVLRWLPSEERLAFFQALVPKAQVNTDWLTKLVSAYGQVRDYRAADAVWSLLETAKDDKQGELASAANKILRFAYFGIPENQYISSFRGEGSKTPSKYRKYEEMFKERAGRGEAGHRLVALLLLGQIDPAIAAERAGELLKDDKLPPETRGNLLQVLLSGAPVKTRHPEAIKALESNDPAQQKVALRYLAEGTSGVQYVHDWRLQIATGIHEEFTLRPLQSQNTPVRVPHVIKTLKPAHVRPLVDSDDPETAAYAGYLLAVMHEDDGVPQLLKYWRTQEVRYNRMTKLVYRGLAALDQPRYLPVLEEIYGKIKDDYDVGEFYWTIRAMGSDGIADLRTKVRNEVPADRIRN